MNQRSSQDFQRQNSRRLWRAIGFLAILVIFALLSASYFIAGMLTQGGGVGLIQEIGQSAQCGRERMLPLADAIDRYARGTGSYPARVEDVAPVYLGDAKVLRCPADHTTPPEKSSFDYERPEPGQSDRVVLHCRHHGGLLMQVRARGFLKPGETAWELQMHPLPPPGAK